MQVASEREVIEMSAQAVLVKIWEAEAKLYAMEVRHRRERYDVDNELDRLRRKSKDLATAWREKRLLDKDLATVWRENVYSTK